MSAAEIKNRLKNPSLLPITVFSEGIVIETFTSASNQDAEMRAKQLNDLCANSRGNSPFKNYSVATLMPGFYIDGYGRKLEVGIDGRTTRHRIDPKDPIFIINRADWEKHYLR